MKNAASPFLLYFTVLFLLLVPACASVPEQSGYLGDYSTLTPGKNFKQEFVSPGTDFSKYTKVRINPVDLTFMDADSKIVIGEEDVKRLSALLISEFEKALSERFEIVPSTGSTDEETLVISPVITQVTAPIRTVNVIATVLPMGFFFSSSGTASFEAKITDGADGTLLAKVAEERQNNLDAKSLLIGGFMKYAQAEAIFWTWAKDLLAFLESRKNPVF